MTLNLDRVRRVSELRQALQTAEGLVAEANRLLAEVPSECDAVVAFSEEGYAVAAAASVAAKGKGRNLAAHRASTLRPLAPAPHSHGWKWSSAEEALGIGPARQWVLEWAEGRGGTGPIALRHLSLSRKVA